MDSPSDQGLNLQITSKVLDQPRVVLLSGLSRNIQETRQKKKEELIKMEGLMHLVGTFSGFSSGIFFGHVVYIYYAYADVTCGYRYRYVYTFIHIYICTCVRNDISIYPVLGKL